MGVVRAQDVSGDTLSPTVLHSSLISLGAGFTLVWSAITAHPTTIAGYGITDAYTKTQSDAQYQPLDSDLTSISALGSAADKGLYTTAAHTWAEFALSSAGRALVDDADAASQRTTLSLGNVENTALSTWAGTTNLTTLGTITTGVWHGTLLGVLYGGTGSDLSATGSAGGVLIQKTAGASLTVAVRPFSVFLGGGAGTTSVTNTTPPAARQEFHNSANHSCRRYADLAGYTQYRVVCHFNGWVAGGKVMVAGSVSAGTFHNLEDVTDAANTAAVTYANATLVPGAWTALDATYAVNNVTLTPFTISGDASTSLTYRDVEVQFR